MHFTGVKVFSATKAKEREELGEVITRWLKANADLEVVDKVVSQSSDNEFHCLSSCVFLPGSGADGAPPRGVPPRPVVQAAGGLRPIRDARATPAP